MALLRPLRLFLIWFTMQSIGSNAQLYCISDVSFWLLVIDNVFSVVCWYALVDNVHRDELASNIHTPNSMGWLTIIYRLGSRDNHISIESSHFKKLVIAELRSISKRKLCRSDFWFLVRRSQLLERTRRIENRHWISIERTPSPMCNLYGKLLKWRFGKSHALPC